MRAKKKGDLGEQCIYIYTKPPPPTLKNTISHCLRGKEVKGLKVHDISRNKRTEGERAMVTLQGMYCSNG